ncbi:MAG: class I SAM-dependent methyltransferase [Chloroflexi bacterium]|nr:class I SAM-dependent methyltransferase [Chloroflexota bacterium]
MTTCGCDGFASIFDERTARGDRDRYRRRGPDRTTAMLLEMIRRRGVDGASVLDVGGGIGMVDQELLRAGAAKAVLVDGSPAYLEVARAEAQAAGLGDRIRLVQGDFTQLAADVEPAEVVTLDRVICCYPDVDALVQRSAARARRLYGLVLPRDGWWVRLLAARVENLWFALRRSPYRAFAHSNALVDRWVAAAGLRRVEERFTPMWRVVLFERGDAAGLAPGGPAA